MYKKNVLMYKKNILMCKKNILMYKKILIKRNGLSKISFKFMNVT